MPKPGPRPYECVRRAWHSDRHQTIRGSIIQRIFSVVDEWHSPATKKNKEWQLKLPFVVLKSEEILYSKANSEAEYSDDETLWDRLKDAINTIIRRDESSETGELLPPCVEAALNLGCFPIRASRSQRHNNPMNYLSPRVEEPPFLHPCSNSYTNEQFLLSANQKRFNNSSILAWETNPHHAPNYNNFTRACTFPFCVEDSPSPAKESNTSTLNLGSVYPLYYQTDELHKISNSDNVLLGVPVGLSSIHHSGIERGIFSSLTSHDNGAENGIADFRANPDVECDLSLRLGLFQDSKR